MINSKTHKVLVMVAATLVISSCNNVMDGAYTIEANDEMAQMIGDTLVSIDESGGKANGDIAQFNPTGYEKAFARLSRKESALSKIANQDISNLFVSKSYATTACSATPFVCNAMSGVSTRTFSDCTIAGSGLATGSVTLTFTGTGASSCTIPLANDRVTRSPNYQITGLRGAIFKVSSLSSGQSLTRLNSTSFTFANNGIRRTFTTSNDKVVLDMQSITNISISVIGTTRGVRILSGGSLIITNNLTSMSCTMSHTNVSWSAGCNCPTSGSWNGSCSDGVALQVVYGSTCGETVLTKGSEVRPVTMDRCQP
ncbi:MAG: hypothetical protein H7235_09120 [Bdellovibrionaceae bacterium]|nr:hypothetical protein [Pseudobdellovibrionaceae bacterium]